MAVAKNKENRPWFPFYASDWLCDERVIALTIMERGAYIQLLAHQWREGSIPSCVRTINRLIGFGAIEMIHSIPEELFDLENVLQFFAKDPNDASRLLNARLEKIRAEQDEKHAERSDSGVKGAKTRWKNKHDSAIAKPSDSHKLVDGKSIAKAWHSESESESEEKENNNARARVDVGSIWAQYVGTMADAQALVQVRDRCERAAAELGKDPSEFTGAAIKAFVSWTDSIEDESMRPAKSPNALLKHFERIQEYASGDRKMAPKAKARATRTATEPPKYEDAAEVVKRMYGDRS